MVWHSHDYVIHYILTVVMSGGMDPFSRHPLLLLTEEKLVLFGCISFYREYTRPIRGLYEIIRDFLGTSMILQD